MSFADLTRDIINRNRKTLIEVRGRNFKTAKSSRSLERDSLTNVEVNLEKRFYLQADAYRATLRKKKMLALAVCLLVLFFLVTAAIGVLA